MSVSPDFHRRPGPIALQLRLRPIDMRHLSRQTLGDWGIQVEVLRLFDERVRRYLASARAARVSAECCRALDLIAGAAAGVGAWSLHDLAVAVEREAQLAGGQPFERLDDLCIAVEEVRTFVAELLKDEPGEVVLLA